MPTKTKTINPEALSDQDRRVLEVHLVLLRLTGEDLTQLRANLPEGLATASLANIAAYIGATMIPDFSADCDIEPGSPDDLSSAYNMVMTLLEQEL